MTPGVVERQMLVFTCCQLVFAEILILPSSVVSSSPLWARSCTVIRHVSGHPINGANSFFRAFVGAAVRVTVGLHLSIVRICVG